MNEYTYPYEIVGYDEFYTPIAQAITNSIEGMDEYIDNGLQNERIFVIEIYENNKLVYQLVKSRFRFYFVEDEKDD